MNFKIGKIYLEWQQQISTNDKTFYLHKIIFDIHFLHEINILKFKYLCWDKIGIRIRNWNCGFQILDNLWKTAGFRISIPVIWNVKMRGNVCKTLCLYFMHFLLNNVNLTEEKKHNQEQSYFTKFIIIQHGYKNG